MSPKAFGTEVVWSHHAAASFQHAKRPREGRAPAPRRFLKWKEKKDATSGGEAPDASSRRRSSACVVS